MYLEILSNLVIKKVYSVSDIYTECNTRSKRRNRYCWAILIKYQGETVYTSGGRTYVSNIDNMVILPKGSFYEWTCTQSGHYAVIEFESDLTYDGILYFPDIDGEKILKLFKELEYKRIVKKPMYEQESIRDVYSIILRLAQQEPKQYSPSHKRSKVSIAAEYIAKNYNSDITNEQLAKLTGLSTVYFRKLFALVYGTSPIAYVHQLRIKKAKEMLMSDYGSITEIAQSLGYASVYDFSRAFKKHTGISPSKYGGEL